LSTEKATEQAAKIVHDVLVRKAFAGHLDNVASIKLVLTFLPIFPGKKAFSR